LHKNKDAIMYISDIKHRFYFQPLSELPDEKLLISTMNAYSFCLLQKDKMFQDAILNSNIVLVDGISVVWAMRFLTGQKLKKIAGADLMAWEMERLQKDGGKCFFLGSKSSTLKKIYDRAKTEYPKVSVQYYEPPFKPSFTEEDNESMISAVNAFSPDVLFIGLTAPKQEKWGASHFGDLKTKHVCCIGAAFDFYAGTVKRAPRWMIKIGLEWFYRLIREPKRNWRRYVLGNFKFVGLILKEKIQMIGHSF
jgi:N-acetylglucosaminyldiphosphoundecaprenol N-acetyl-beta-D-mannosaminyltransferase